MEQFFLFLWTGELQSRESSELSSPRLGEESRSVSSGEDVAFSLEPDTSLYTGCPVTRAQLSIPLHLDNMVEKFSSHINEIMWLQQNRLLKLRTHWVCMVSVCTWSQLTDRTFSVSRAVVKQTQIMVKIGVC